MHELIVEGNDDTTAGTSSVGDVEYTLEFVAGKHPGDTPETVHEKAYHLLQLLVANHPFVDGNKRTALATTVLFYALNGLEFDYDREAKRILKAFGTDQRDVGASRVGAYLEAHAKQLDEEDVADRSERRGLVRFLVKRDVERHEDIYEELARE